MDAKYSLLQLRNAGVIAALEMRRAGFPNRLLYKHFILRYHMLAPKAVVEATRQDRATNELMASAVRDIMADERVKQVLTSDMYAFGSTKLFLRAEAQRVLDSLRARVMYSSIVLVQAFLRRCRTRVAFVSMREMAVWMQSTWRGVAAREKYKEMINAIRSRKKLQLLALGLAKLSARITAVETKEDASRQGMYVCVGALVVCLCINVSNIYIYCIYLYLRNTSYSVKLRCTTARLRVPILSRQEVLELSPKS
jgi:myosin heavy subunit